MAYESVDKLQNMLSKNVFHYAKDSKKAAGRALGTLVEIITFYLLKAWGYSNSVAIEKGLSEYGNPQITHNVEYSLHPIIGKWNILLNNIELPLTANKKKNQFTKLQMQIDADYALQTYFRKNLKRIESWFNTITPTNKDIDILKRQIDTLRDKNWGAIYKK
ncbi:MAG: hypothetical protein QME12_02870 [Nanoarchaeota archaeon]|nr:hypothetical protein [Nanoarchaeota archaeon]